MATVAEALSRALRQQQAGQLAQAERIYREILQADPQQPEALHLLGVLEHQVGKSEPAIEHIGAAIAAAPAQAAFHASLANVLLAQGWHDRALASCREALRLQPDSSEAHLALANVHRAQGRLDEAEAAYRTVLGRSAGHAYANSHLATVLRSRGQLREAETHYRIALRAQPNHAVTWMNLAAVLRPQGRSEESTISPMACCTTRTVVITYSAKERSAFNSFAFCVNAHRDY
jgi:tetratricopeptide (TPR) repeat protein